MARKQDTNVEESESLRVNYLKVLFGMKMIFFKIFGVLFLFFGGGGSKDYNVTGREHA